MLAGYPHIQGRQSKMLITRSEIRPAPAFCRVSFTLSFPIPIGDNIFGFWNLYKRHFDG